MRYALDAFRAGEEREWQRVLWASAIGVSGAKAPKDLPRLIAPDFTDTQAVAGRPTTPPYPISAAVALALNDALGLGLLTNEVWSSWPAARDGRPLSRIWEGILKSGGLS